MTATRFLRQNAAFALVFALGTTAACEGNIATLATDEFTDPDVAKACEVRTLPPQPLRRLSSEQYHNVIYDLFGGDRAGPLLTDSLFPETRIVRGFLGDAAANVVGSSESYAIEDNAERIGEVVRTNAATWANLLMPCAADLSDATIDSCIDGFIVDFGKRAFRRPLRDSEIALAKQVFTNVRATQNGVHAWSAVVQFFVAAPPLLYRIEEDYDTGPNDSLVQISDWAMASRLSFLFTNSAPDAELVAAAQANQLHTKEQIAAHARRLLDSPRFYDMLGAFHRDWLHGYERGPKDGNLFPNYTEQVAAAFSRELTEFGKAVVESGGNIETLLSTTDIPVNATMANFYQVAAPSSEAWEPRSIPGRKGILTLASVQAALAKNAASSPIHRGNFFRTEVLCRPMIVFPGNLDTTTALENTASLPTARQRYAPLLTVAPCSGCHQQMNQIGFAFENFDAVGAFRSHENGTTIDVSGVIDVGNGPQPFADAAGFVAAIAPSQMAQECYSLQWFRAMNGRVESDEDACSIAHLNSMVRNHNGDLRELMIALTQTDAFRFRRIKE